MSKGTLRKIGEIYCANTPTYVLGDHDHGADPSFYAVHPAVERVFQMAVLSGAIEPSLWTASCASEVRCFPGVGDIKERPDECCEGHAPSDAWHTNLTHAKAASYTLQELLQLANPTDHKDIQYPIFHHFHFDHCNYTNFTAYDMLTANDVK